MRVGKQAIVDADLSPLPAPVPSMACYCTILSRALPRLRSARHLGVCSQYRFVLHEADHSWEGEASPRDIQIDLMAQSTHRQRLNEASIR